MLDPEMRRQVEGEVTSPSQLVSIQELLRELLDFLTEIIQDEFFRTGSFNWTRQFKKFVLVISFPLIFLLVRYNLE